MRSVLFLWLGLMSLSAQLVPWPENPWYWSDQGKPILLLGGSDDDNLFQWPPDKLVPQLDLIAEAGGNVVRNTMSDRPVSGFELYPFAQREDGLYDLEKWNESYWKRFEQFLAETKARNIYVQIEIWDRFDYTDKDGENYWQRNPYRPKNNINYTAEESGFADRYPKHPGANAQPFFFTTPKQRHNRMVLTYQEAFVNKLLDHSLAYDHVLYCMDNETKAEPAWGRHWAEFVKRRAAEANKTVMVTEMWDAWNLTSEEHRQTFDHPELYDFVDVSQNNQNRGYKHWTNFLFVRNYLAKAPRPMNTTKTYGADGNKFKHTDQDAIERFWRHLLAGAASIRFHRPPSGLGINDKAMKCLRAARLLESDCPMWTLTADNKLLSDRDENEAYLASNGETLHVVYFTAETKPGSVGISLSKDNDAFNVKWIDIDAGSQHSEDTLKGGIQTLTSPSAGNMVAIIQQAQR